MSRSETRFQAALGGGVAPEIWPFCKEDVLGGGSREHFALKPSYPWGANSPMTQGNRVYWFHQNTT